MTWFAAAFGRLVALPTWALLALIAADVVVHETGHLLVARCWGARFRGIAWPRPWRIAIRVDGARLGPIPLAVVALGGCAAEGAAWGLCRLLAGPHALVTVAAGFFTVVNGVVNLTPGPWPSDGRHLAAAWRALRRPAAS